MIAELAPALVLAVALAAASIPWLRSVRREHRTFRWKARRFANAMTEMQIALGTAMIPTMRRAVKAMAEFQQAMLKTAALTSVRSRR